jgi:glycosyltransferase involved in cell wall biosynthesis
MSSIAFYAPLKPPTHPTPSGDRAVARALLKAMGRQAVLVSELRVYDGKGDASIQVALIAAAKIEAQKLIIQGHKQGWQAWFTYHNYYKSPDLIGPIVSKALGIPYILLEATRAKKRLEGPWEKFAELAEAACDHADAILYFTQHDRQALEAYRHNDQQIVHLPPFLAETETVPSRDKPKSNTILSVGMMRAGAKSQSYNLIAQTLRALKQPDWQLTIVGDGPARSDIETLFTTFGKQVTFLGQLDKTAIAELYRNASVFLWPGVDEAFGMVCLEAQAAGLPVVAQDRPGLRAVIAPTTKLSAVDTVTDMAQDIDHLLNDSTYWQYRSLAGIEHIRKNHLLETARKKIMAVLTPLIGSKL